MWTCSSESFVLFAGGKPYEAKLPARQLLSNAIDIRFTQPIKKPITFMVEVAKAKETDPCMPDKWEKYTFNTVCSDNLDFGNFTIVSEDRGGCRMTLPCLSADFIRVSVKPEKEGAPAPEGLDSVTISLTVR